MQKELKIPQTSNKHYTVCLGIIVKRMTEQSERKHKCNAINCHYTLHYFTLLNLTAMQFDLIEN